jgi:hypothetical protein
MMIHPMISTRTRTPQVRQELHHIYDVFSKPEACLVADTIEYLSQQGLPFDPALVGADVQGAIGEFDHRPASPPPAQRLFTQRLFTQRLFTQRLFTQRLFGR